MGAGHPKQQNKSHSHLTSQKDNKAKLQAKNSLDQFMDKCQLYENSKDESIQCHAPLKQIRRSNKTQIINITKKTSSLLSPNSLGISEKDIDDSLRTVNNTLIQGPSTKITVNSIMEKIKHPNTSQQIGESFTNQQMRTLIGKSHKSKVQSTMDKVQRSHKLGIKTEMYSIDKEHTQSNCQILCCYNSWWNENQKPNIVNTDEKNFFKKKKSDKI